MDTSTLVSPLQVHSVTPSSARRGTKRARAYRWGCASAVASCLLGWSQAQAAPAAERGTESVFAAATVLKATGSETVSAPYSFEVDVELANASVDFARVLGTPLTLTTPSGLKIAGMVERVEQTGASGGKGRYHLRVVPRWARLAYRQNSRSFAQLSVPDITKRLMGELGIAFEMRLSASYAKREVTIQYRETDLQFLSRLLESEGISYHFEQGERGEVIVFSDSNDGFPVSGSLPYVAEGRASIVSFSRGAALFAGKVEVTDYLWEKPNLVVREAATSPSSSSLNEVLAPAFGIGSRSPGADAKRLARLRVESNEANASACQGESTDAGLHAGQRFTLTQHPRRDFNTEYLIVSVEHQGGAGPYRNQFHCVVASRPYRPPMVSNVPTIAGVVPAIVVGPNGSAKHVDQYGRVKVRFPWFSAVATDPATPDGDAGWVRVVEVGLALSSRVSSCRPSERRWSWPSCTAILVSRWSSVVSTTAPACLLRPYLERCIAASSKFGPGQARRRSWSWTRMMAGRGSRSVSATST